MKNYLIAILLSLAVFPASGCAPTIKLTSPLMFPPVESQSITLPVNVHLGVIISPDVENYTISKMFSNNVAVGEAIKANIGSSLNPIFTKVTVARAVADLPADVNYLAYLRFAPDTNFEWGNAAFFTDSVGITALDFQVYEKTANRLCWKTVAKGVVRRPAAVQMAETLLPAGNITYAAENSRRFSKYHEDIVSDSVRRALVDLNQKLIASGLSEIGAKKS